jgi:pimeloyl-ACP methyl ester carboxylesterase
MFEGFVQATIDTGEAQIRVRHGGSGPPVLLLHGIPETHAMWHKVARTILDYMLDGWSGTPNAFPPEVRAEYARAFANPETLHAICRGSP